MRPIWLRKTFVFILFIFAAGSIPKLALPQNIATSEYEIKAAFIFNFAKFIEWPQKVLGETNGSFIIGILGRDPFGGALEQTIGGKTVKGKSIFIRRFRQLDDLQYCHILFISESEKDNLPAIFDKIKYESILTVGDMPEFARNGGMISLYTEENRVRFAVYIKATERANLKLSAKLLNLAKIITE
jgi:hypothetical protein